MIFFITVQKVGSKTSSNHGKFFTIRWEGAMRTLDKGRTQCSTYTGGIIFRLDMILQSETENVNIREYHIKSFS